MASVAPAAVGYSMVWFIAGGHSPLPMQQSWQDIRFRISNQPVGYILLFNKTSTCLIFIKVS
jgi:hypothetical protein